MSVIASLLPVLCPSVRVLKDQEDGGVAPHVCPHQPHTFALSQCPCPEGPGGRWSSFSCMSSPASYLCCVPVPLSSRPEGWLE